MTDASEKLDIEALPLIQELPRDLTLPAWLEARHCAANSSVVLWDRKMQQHTEVPLPLEAKALREAKGMLWRARAHRNNQFPSLSDPAAGDAYARLANEEERDCA